MIYIVSHKPVNLPDFSGYKLLQVGSCDENFPGFLRDNTGDNIARKNANYCELTAMYWIWRNVREDHKGLVHYRRFFGRRLFGNLGDVLSYEALMDTLKGHDILIPRPVVYHTSAKEQLLMESCTDDTFEKLTAVFYGIHPDYMADYEAFFRNNKASQYNMLFCSADLFDRYSAWLFPVLFQLEVLVDLSGANDYQKRLFGFLSERLLNVWIRHNQLDAVFAPVVHTEYTKLDYLTYLRRDITNGVRFRILNGR